MTGKVFVNMAKNVCFWMICSFAILPAPDAHATTVNYTLNNVILGGTAQMTGAFSWTYTGDFENGVGQWDSLSIPWTSHNQFDLNTTFEPTSSIEITFPGNVHDDGVDITLFLLQSLTPTTPASLDLVRSKYDIGGNGFHSGTFLSGSIVPVVVPTGDFDADGDTDGSDFLMWQRGEVTSPPSASDLATWESDYGTVTPLSAATSAVPEPSTVLLGVLGSFFGISFRRHLNTKKPGGLIHP